MKILDWAKVMGFRDGENPARLKDIWNISFKQKKIVTHQPALPFRELPAFGLVYEIRAFRQMHFGSDSNNGRSNEVIGAFWDEIDWQNAVWSIPAERMKMKRSHRIPLAQTSLDILSKRRAFKNSLLFSKDKILESR